MNQIEFKWQIHHKFFENSILYSSGIARAYKPSVLLVALHSTSPNPFTCEQHFMIVPNSWANPCVINAIEKEFDFITSLSNVAFASAISFVVRCQKVEWIKIEKWNYYIVNFSIWILFLVLATKSWHLGRCNAVQSRIYFHGIRFKRQFTRAIFLLLSIFAIKA